MPRIFGGRAAAATFALALILAACGDDDTDTNTDTAAPPETTQPDTEPDTEPDVEPDEPVEEPVASTTIEVTVTAGQVTGGGRHPVSLGDTVMIRVTSDVADHIHLHGYDVLVDVAPGEPAELTFDATIPGVFEVELEDARIKLLDLEIR